MSDFIFQCECCDAEYLIDPELQEYELLTPDLSFDEIEQLNTDPAQYREAYQSGRPVVPGERQGDVVVNTPITQQGSGIRVETNVGAPKPQAPRQKRVRNGMTAPTNFSATRPPKKKKLSEADMARDGFTVEGSHPSQDFTGLTGMEAHLDNLQQAQFESDPYGFQSQGVG